MHSYLKSVGFSKLEKKELDEIIREVIQKCDEKYAAESESHTIFAEYIKYYGGGCGISVCGEFEEDGSFRVEYYYPIFRGTGITTHEKITVERHAEKESFAGACDDLRIGVTLIFYLQNPAEYMKKGKREEEIQKPLILSGLAEEGKILFAVKKDKELVKIEQETTKTRNNLIEAARNGDEDAMESLTMEDMDLYSVLTKRIETEDIMTIVDSYFMPYGIECDRYGVMGEIEDFSYVTNERSGEKLCCMTLKSNDLKFDIVINEKDLLGEPAVGRRFKGNLWLQGMIQY